MADYWETTVHRGDERRERVVYLYKGEGVPWEVGERLDKSPDYVAELIEGSWSDYVSFTSGYDNRQYRLYAGNRKGEFYIELPTYKQ